MISNLEQQYEIFVIKLVTYNMRGIYSKFWSKGNRVINEYGDYNNIKMGTLY